jgi:hypothetical protein
MVEQLKRDHDEALTYVGRPRNSAHIVAALMTFYRITSKVTGTPVPHAIDVARLVNNATPERLARLRADAATAADILGSLLQTIDEEKRKV